MDTTIDDKCDDLAKDIFQKYSTPTDVDFKIFTTLRYDPSTYSDDIPVVDAVNYIPLHHSFFYLLSEHIDKLKRAGEYFNFPIKNLNMDSLLFHLTLALRDADKLVSHRVKITVSKDGEYGIEFASLPKSNILLVNIPTYESFQSKSSNNMPAYLKQWVGWTIYLDTAGTMPTPFTSFKTTNRKAYDEARARFDIVPGDKREVLLYDLNEIIMEGSITSVAFWRKVKNPNTGDSTFQWVTPALSVGCMDGVLRKYLLDNNKIVEGKLKVNDLRDGEIVLIFNGLMGIHPAILVR